jgi:hypothetical protein
MAHASTLDIGDCMYPGGLGWQTENNGDEEVVWLEADRLGQRQQSSATAPG